MPETREDTALVAVDSMKLADQAFQGSRHIYDQGDLILDLLSRTLVRVRQSDALVVQIPRSWVQDLDPYFQESIKPDAEAEPVRVSDLPSERQSLLSFVELGGDELRRLSQAGLVPAIQSLGYALHNFPRLVRSGDEPFDSEGFQFCFRIVAFCWSDISTQMQQALCDLAGIEYSEAKELANEDGFAIDMYGHSPETHEDGEP